LALSVGVASIGHSATSAAAVVVAGPGSDADLDQAKVLYEKGKAKYDTFDYNGAIDMWTEAYAIVPDDAAKTRNLLAYNIATAQEKAYEVDNDVSHLKTAKLLLESYIANYKAINKKTPEAKAEVAKAEDRIAGLQAAIEAHEGKAAPEPAPAPALQSNEPPPETPAPPKQEDPPEVAAEKRKAKGMIAGGYASMGVGLAMLVASGISHGVAKVAESTDNTVDMIDGTSEPSPTARRARTAGWVLLGIGAAGLVACGVLLGLGYSKRAKANRGEVAFSPYGGPDGGGAVLRVRF
jgi:hypothetical protein